MVVNIQTMQITKMNKEWKDENEGKKSLNKEGKREKIWKINLFNPFIRWTIDRMPKIGPNECPAVPLILSTGEHPGIFFCSIAVKRVKW